MRIWVFIWSILSTFNNSDTASELSEIIHLDFSYSVWHIGLSDILVVFVVRYNYEVLPGATGRDKKNAVLEYNENRNTSSSFHNMFLPAKGGGGGWFHGLWLHLLFAFPSTLPQI